ncbi:hypothetical protein MVEN_02243000 [Mycena venus]|uniref:Uncharacterized protein n=1 Tax=Mycena venus TaxID=2733690 RepID=A0A8H7CGU8_9AGAR|nr:hypothetical protein MVEN_02243000 [Mycena venus]
MDDEHQSDPEFTKETNLDGPDRTTDQYIGAFFTKAKHVVIAGGKFKSVTHIHHPTSSDPTDIRMIPIGDLDLLHKIGHPRESGLVRRRQGRSSVRRMYTARIHGSRTRMTAVLYQGDGAEESSKSFSNLWDNEHGLPTRCRVPRWLLFSSAKFKDSNGSYAWLDLILWTELQEKYRNSHFATVFFWACMVKQFRDIDQYILSVSGRQLYRSEYIVWIRSSTGHLCIELTPPESVAASLIRVGGHFRPSGTSLLDPPEASETINAMSLQHYHSICYWHLNRPYHLLISTNIPVNLGTIRHFSGPEYEGSFEIAFASDCGVYDAGWLKRDPSIEDFWNPIDYSEEGTSILRNGWIRLNSANIEDEYQRQIFSDDSRSWSWLAQANHIFNSLDIKSNFEDYVFVERIRYSLKFFGADFLPPGYLFLCPLVELKTEVPGCLGIPDCPAYWSLDPSGAERLSPEKASNIGFPEIELCTQVYGRSWDSSVHAGIRQFHEAKGFDPYDQEVALELGVPLFQVSCDQDALCARLQRNDAEDDYSDSDRTSNRDDFSESAQS